MPRSSGTYTRTNGVHTGSTVWAQDEAAGTDILSARQDVHDQDIADALTASLAKDGQTNPTANLPMATYRHTGVGNASARTDYAATGQVQDGAFIWCGTAGGTKNALTLTPAPAITALATGQKFRFKAGTTASDSTVTIDVSGVGAVAGQIDDAALSASIVIEANKYYEALYDGTALQLTRLSLDTSGYSTTPLTQGVHTIGVASGGITPTTTAGCAALAKAETTTNKINYKYLAFDASSEEKAFFWFPTPKSYNASTFTMRATWTHPATATNFGVVWEFEILALANDDAMDTAVGTAVTVADTGGTTEDFYLSPESGAITPSNTAAKQDWMYCQISRKVLDASDNMGVDAHLIGVEVYYTIDAGNDA